MQDANENYCGFCSVIRWWREKIHWRIKWNGFHSIQSSCICPYDNSDDNMIVVAVSAAHRSSFFVSASEICIEPIKFNLEMNICQWSPSEITLLIDVVCDIQWAHSSNLTPISVIRGRNRNGVSVATDDITLNWIKRLMSDHVAADFPKTNVIIENGVQLWITVDGADMA